MPRAHADAEVRRQPPEILASGVWRENAEGRCPQSDRRRQRTPRTDRTELIELARAVWPDVNGEEPTI